MAPELRRVTDKSERSARPTSRSPATVARLKPKLLRNIRASSDSLTLSLAHALEGARVRLFAPLRRPRPLLHRRRHRLRRRLAATAASRAISFAACAATVAVAISAAVAARTDAFWPLAATAAAIFAAEARRAASRSSARYLASRRSYAATLTSACPRICISLQACRRKSPETTLCRSSRGRRSSARCGRRGGRASSWAGARPYSRSPAQSDEINTKDARGNCLKEVWQPGIPRKGTNHAVEELSVQWTCRPRSRAPRARKA